MNKKNKKGFTLIEILAVIAIIAILVLLASPSIASSKAKAKLAHIKNDVKVAENLLTEKRLEDERFYLSSLPTSEPKDKLYSYRGEEKRKGPFYDITALVDSNLKGYFLSDKDGYVYYTETSDSRPINSINGGHHVNGLYSGGKSGGVYRNDKPIFNYSLNLSENADDRIYSFMFEVKDKNTGEVIEFKTLGLTKENGKFYKAKGLDFKHTEIKPTKENLKLYIEFEKPEGDFNYEVRKVVSVAPISISPQYVSSEEKLTLTQDKWINNDGWKSNRN